MTEPDTIEPGRLQPGIRAGIEAGLRRTAPPGPLPTENEPGLLELIRAEIALSGPLTFARFMEIVLYDPDHGYYRSSTARPDRSGDFLTAPETHPIFGATVARRLAAAWTELGRPDPFVVREYGAGSGTLAVTILAGLRAEDSPLADAVADALVVDPVEVNVHRRAEFTARLAVVGGRLRTAGADEPFSGVVLANEFLDALPIHRVEQRGGRLHERFVDWDDEAGTLVERAAQPSTAGLAERLDLDGVTLAEGQVGEICLGLDPWLAEVDACLKQGLILILDYGHRAADLYDPTRIGGSLRAYAGQRAHADPFIALGRQDLTAHVDFSAVEALAAGHGFRLLRDRSQAEFLVDSGLEELLGRVRSNPATTMADWLAVRSAVARLLDPGALGGFRAVELGRGLGSEAAH